MFDPFPQRRCDHRGFVLMGVPVLCLEGDTYVSRQGVMQNRCLGLEAFIAGDTGEFIEKAVQISNNADLLLQLRQNLRGMLQQSALMDYDGYVAEFKTMLNRWWAKRCAEYQEIGQATNQPTLFSSSQPSAWPTVSSGLQRIISTLLV